MSKTNVKSEEEQQVAAGTEETAQETAAAETPKQDTSKAKPGQLAKVPVASLKPSPFNPRPISQAHVEELKLIHKNDPKGVVQEPIQVVEDKKYTKSDGDESAPNKMYFIVNGHHRCEMYKQLNYTDVIVSVLDIPDDEAAIKVLTTNRSLALDQLAIGIHYKKLEAAKKAPAKHVYADKIGKQPTYVSNALAIAGVYMKCPADLQKQIDERNAQGRGVSTHLLVISRVIGVADETLETLVTTLLEQDQSVKDVENSVGIVMQAHDQANRTAHGESGGTTKPNTKGTPEKGGRQEVPGSGVTDPTSGADALTTGLNYLVDLANAADEQLDVLKKLEVNLFIEADGKLPDQMNVARDVFKSVIDRIDAMAPKSKPRAAKQEGDATDKVKKPEEGEAEKPEKPAASKPAAKKTATDTGKPAAKK